MRKKNEVTVYRVSTSRSISATDDASPGDLGYAALFRQHRRRIAGGRNGRTEGASRNWLWHRNRRVWRFDSGMQRRILRRTAHLRRKEKRLDVPSSAVDDKDGLTNGSFPWKPQLDLRSKSLKRFCFDSNKWNSEGQVSSRVQEAVGSHLGSSSTKITFFKEKF